MDNYSVAYSLWNSEVVLNFLNHLMLNPLYFTLRILLICQRFLAFILSLPFIFIVYLVERLGFHFCAVLLMKTFARLIFFFSGYHFKAPSSKDSLMLVFSEDLLTTSLLWAHSKYKSLSLQPASFFHPKILSRFMMKLGFMPVPTVFFENSLKKSLLFLEPYISNQFQMIQCHSNYLSQMPAVVFLSFIQEKPLHLYKVISSKDFNQSTVFSRNTIALEKISVVYPHKRLALHVQNVQSIIKNSSRF